MRTRVLNYFHTFHPEAQAEHDRLAREDARLALEQARQPEVPAEDRPKRRMSEKSRDVEAERAQVQAALAEQAEVIKSGVVRIHIKGLTRSEFRRLLIAHPAREDDQLDAQVGYNVDSFGEALIEACIIRTEDLDGNPVPNEWGAWADEMTNGQWEEVFRACLSLTNEGTPSLPR